jgi:hypothetical protein
MFPRATSGGVIIRTVDARELSVRQDNNRGSLEWPPNAKRVMSADGRRLQTARCSSVG